MTQRHGAPCTIRIYENEHGAISVDSCVDVTDPRDLTIIQQLVLVGVGAIVDGIVERRRVYQRCTHAPGSCPDCGPAMGDATYRETFEDGQGN